MNTSHKVHAGDHIPRASSPPDDDAASEGARGGLGFELHGHSDSVGPAGLKPAVPVESGHLSLTRGPFYYARGATTGLRVAVLLASIVFSFKKKASIVFPT